MSKEMAELAAIMQNYGTVENTNVTSIDEWLNDPNHYRSQVGARISKEEIFSEILGVTLKSGVIVPPVVEQAYKNWANVQKCWRKVDGAVRYGGKVTRGVYERIYTEADMAVKRRSNMVNVAPGEEDKFIDIIGIIRKRREKYGYRDFGDPFPITGLSEEEIQALVDSGYIYEDGEHSYALMTLP